MFSSIRAALVGCAIILAPMTAQAAVVSYDFTADLPDFSGTGNDFKALTDFLTANSITQVSGSASWETDNLDCNLAQCNARSTSGLLSVTSNLDGFFNTRPTHLRISRDGLSFVSTFDPGLEYSSDTEIGFSLRTTGTIWFSDSGHLTGPGVVYTNTSVSAVPLPASALLLGTVLAGVFGAGGMMRRRA